MALFHFHAAQVKRSAGQSAVACAAYRAASKGMTIDLKRVAHAVSYMQTNNILRPYPICWTQKQSL